MEPLSKDKLRPTIDLGDFFWKHLAPGFLIKIRNQIREWRLKRYKMKKVKESKLIRDENYYMEFNIIIDDENNQQCLGPFNITVPAKGAYFAKRKLRAHIKEVVEIDVLHIDREDNPHTVYHRSTDTSVYNVILYNREGEMLDTIRNVEALTSREAYLKVSAYVVEHEMWDAVKKEEMD